MSDALAPARARALPALGRALAPALFLGIAFLLTAGVWADPTHSWSGTPGDAYKFMDFLAWTPHAVAHLENPLFMGVIDYPTGVNLAWETSVPLGGLLIWPVTATLGPIAAFNTFILMSVTLDGWCAHLWLRRHVSSRWAAGIAALLLILGPWTSTHLSQLNLISFWPLPLMFMAAEDLFTAARPRIRSGLLLGFTAVVQLYLAEELLALAAIGLVMALLAAVLVQPRRALSRLRAAAIPSALGLVVFVVLAAPLLVYQFRGPARIHGLIHPPGFYVTDLQNFLIPTPTTWLWPHAATATHVSSWSGIAEATGYVGLPLLLVTVYAAVRWWREPLVKVVTITTAASALLSLGPHLHIEGVDSGIRLPGVFLSHLPLLENLLPARLSLITDFGLALMLAIALDRSLTQRPPQRAAIAALASVAVLSIVSVFPAPASSVPTPAYFAAGGGASHLPAGSVALVGPYIDDGLDTPVVMLWQAESGFHFSLIDGLAITADRDGHATFLPDTPIRAAFHQIQVAGQLPDESPAARAAWLDSLRSEGVNVVILGPMPHRDRAVAFVEWLIGRPANDSEGVSVWNGIPAA